MLEKQSIQQRGFHNTLENGKVTGYQLRVRSLYYRGLWLSQIKSVSLSVDSEEIEQSKIRFSVGDKAYTLPEMKELGDVHWDILEPAILLVEKEGGLAPGEHTIELTIMHSSSYMPPEMDFILSTMNQKRNILLV